MGTTGREQMMRSLAFDVPLHGWRGRAYVAPVRLVRPVVVSAMPRRAVRDLARRGRRG